MGNEHKSGLSKGAVTCNTSLQLSMLDGPLKLWVTLPIVDTIHSKGNNLVRGVKIKATGEQVTQHLQVMTAL